MNPHSQIIVVGGGAAGFFAAIRAAEVAPESEVTILERGRKVLGKVSISGGGRCNVTHACWEPRELAKHYPRGEKEMLGPFHRFACGDTIDWFEKRGVRLKIEEDGRMFPVTDDSATIVDCLWRTAAEAGVKVRKGCRLEGLQPPAKQNGRWMIATKGATFEADRLLVATGSNPAVWKILEQLGHTVVPPVPSLFTFNIKDRRLEGLAGLSVPEATVSIKGRKLTARGPLLVTHWGLSGPGILRLSAWGARRLAEMQYRFEIGINWLSQHPEENRQYLLTLTRQLAARQVQPRPQFHLPARLWRRLVQSCGIGPDTRWAELNKRQVSTLSETLTDCRLQVSGKSTFKEEFVTAGGIDLREVDFKTFQSKLHPGLFFAGEVLDIDAITGGFNFQAAWTGGWIAGGAMAATL